MAKASGYHGTGLSEQLNVFWNVAGDKVRSCSETDSKKKKKKRKEKEKQSAM